MSIQGDIKELKGINLEIKSLSTRLKILRKEAKKVDENIRVYMHSKEVPGVKHRGEAIILEETKKRVHKPSKQRDLDAIDVLYKYGVHNPEKIFEELMEARKGEQIVSEKIKMKKYKDSEY
jgi:hypothetical protein